MRKVGIETTLRVRLPHRPGQLARLATAIAEADGVIGDIKTLRVGEHESVRDVVVEAADEPHTARIVAAVKALDGIEVSGTADIVFERHRGGKIEVKSRVDIRELRDLRHVYTPGVARVSTAIANKRELAWELTGIGSSVGIFTNGSRVLGLGDIGPLASLPVMEGKAALYAIFSGISATPILVDTHDPDVFVETVKRLASGFGGIHLEDISSPECFAIERALDEALDKPVMHDDQHGTATAALAAVLNACKMTGVDPRASRLGQIGLGAAGSAIARLALAYGVKSVLVSDRSEAAVASVRADGAEPTDLATLLRESEIVIAATGRPNLIDPSMVRKGQILFALSNPDPEIAPEDALAAGAAFAGDGRSINNALAFPGLFKAALAVRSRSITARMRVAAAEAIALLAPAGEVVPSPLDPGVHEAVMAAAEAAARAEGLAGTARA
ncbi:MAG TPA: ACT domain-containing protein [Labilithrix sp.]|jgi:malate dehydrogenase (oxaloacetate-decarboxylating)